MNTPLHLHIVAPAGACDKKKIKEGLKTVEALGYSFTEGAFLYHKHGYLAGTDAERLADLQTALNDRKTAGIWVARGGYGTTRIMDALNWKSFLKKPSWIIGFSDITSLHIFLSNNNIPSIHAPMVGQVANPDHQNALVVLDAILKKEYPEYILEGSSFNRAGKARAPITGGNLTLITSSLGTDTEIITDNKILFIEDVGEAAYRIDRMMVQLKRAGKLKKLKGLIVGQFTSIIEEKEFGKNVSEIIDEHTREYTYPVCYQFPAGHDVPNMPLILGLKSELIVEKKETRLRYL